MENEEREYKIAMRAFYRKYNEMRRYYNLRLRCISGINCETTIKVYKEALNGRTLVLDVQEADETTCYKRALEELESYEMIIRTA